MGNQLIIIILLGSIVSLIGTMIGASLGVIVKNPSNKLLGGLIGFSSGLMLAVVVFQLIPDSVKNWSFKGTLLFSIIGMAIIFLVDNFLTMKNIKVNRHVKVALMTALGLMLHNFPEGIIMGCGFLAGEGLGIKMAIIISIHDIPEGIAVSAPLMVSKIKISRILFYAFLTALPTAFGVFAGAIFGSISTNFLGAFLSLASGIMLYVVCGEMIKESNRLYDGVTTTVGILGGIILGFIITNVL